MHKLLARSLIAVLVNLAGTLLLPGIAQGLGSTLTVTRSSELRADKLASAATLAVIEGGASVELMSLEGGWALINYKGRPGWVRAGTLALSASASAASLLPSGRAGSNNQALTLGVRGMPPRAGRHALIINLGRYADASVPLLPGSRADAESATQMATAMQIPISNIQYLADEQATATNIRRALSELGEKAAAGDRVFIHFSGHGTRYADPTSGECVEALLAYESGWNGMLTSAEMARLMKPLASKTDKLFVIYDACYSGGLTATSVLAKSRSLAELNGEDALRPRFTVSPGKCSAPTNARTRDFLPEMLSHGLMKQDIAHISSARNDQVAMEDPINGGLATQYMRDCMLRDAKDLDGSGAITVEELRQCAQEKVEQRMKGNRDYSAQTLTVSGNAGFVPAWFAQGSVTTAVAPVAIVVPPTTPAKPAAPSAPVPPALTGEQALTQVFDQRDAKRKVVVTLVKDTLKINEDTLSFAVQSERPGYLYVALAGSDNQSLYLLFPNDLDGRNRIDAGQQVLLPRPSWAARAAGPAGTDTLLVMVADSPRDLTGLTASKAGPFSKSLNDAQGRRSLGALMTASKAGADPLCRGASSSSSSSDSACSDAFGAALARVEEIR